MIGFEKVLLGACLLDPTGTFSRVVETIQPEMLSADARAVFSGMKSLLERGEPIDRASLRCQVRKESPEAEQALSDLGAELPRITRESVDSWTLHIREAAKRRRIAQETFRIAEASKDESLSSSDLLARLQALAFDLDAGTVSGTSFGPVDLMRAASRAIDDIAASADGLIGIPSGIKALDDMTGGFRPGQYVAIGARPSVGKSSLALQIADHAANIGHTVAFFSLEMEAAELALVRACGEAQVSKFKIQVTRGEGPHMPHVFGAIMRQAKTPLYVEKLSSPSLGPIRARAARIKAERGLGMIVVDYLQLMRGESKRSNRNEELTEISAGLKNMASALGVPILVCAQLNRQAAGTDNPQPRLSQFRDSGSIEADADVAILLHRRDEKAPKNEPMAVDLLVEKNRTGACGAVGMSFVGKFQRFYPEGQNDE